jgi:hypothetical protein
MNFHGQTMPKAMIRAGQIGDWRHGLNSVVAYSAEIGDERSEFLIAMHELVEGYLCREANITDFEVTEFDLAHPKADEPGDLRAAPYHKQHVVAMKVEKILGKALGVKWRDHEARIGRALSDGK